MNPLITLLAKGRHEELEVRARGLVGEFPLSGWAWLLLGAALEAQGRPSLSALRRAVSLQPGNAVAHCNLGIAEQRLGHIERAGDQFRLALGISPDLAMAHYHLGVGLQALGCNEEAALAFRRALAISPEYFDAYFRLGQLEQNLGHPSVAIEIYEAAIPYNPDFFMIYYNLGLALQSLERHAEAIDQYQRALGLKPQFPDALYNLAIAHKDLGQIEEAIACCLKALELDPGHFQANLFLNLIYMGQKRLVDSEKLCRKALEVNPEFAEMRQSLARALSFLSDFKEVVAESDRAFKDKPDQTVMWEQRLYSFSYHPDLSAEDIFKEFVRWGDRFPAPRIDFAAHDRNPDRRLRIGYVSPDFRAHSSRFYFWPLFCNHDRKAFELFAYSNVGKEVVWTDLFKGQFEHWRDIRGVGDAAVADQIREDGIDILVDLCGHMRDDRLGVFTLKPAPIQATWLGSAWTTGLKTIDYALFDRFTAPAGTLTREAIIHLPHSYFAFQPPVGTADLAPAPCLKSGYVTFGYTGRTERLNHRIFRVWGEILRRLPEARLILDFGPFADPQTQAHYRELMERHGMDTARVIMRKSPRIFEGLNDIDIILDSFPHSGGTMLMDAFWMGVPAVTLASRPPVGRLGTSMLMNLGLPEWVATTEAEYVDKACHFAGDPQALNVLRLGMRERMQGSPLMDGPGFARGFENAYRSMFEGWLKGNPLPVPAETARMEP